MPEPLNLETLVAQHFERLNHILTNTIRQLEELRTCIPDAALKDGHPMCPHCNEPHPRWIFSCAKAREYVANEKALQQTLLETGERVPPEVARGVPPVEFLPVLHDELMCRAYYKRCKCPCAECLIGCVKRQSDEIICCTSDAPCEIHGKSPE